VPVKTAAAPVPAVDALLGAADLAPRAADLDEVELRRSEQEDLQKEQRDLQEALLRSKADTWSADGVVLSRLTFHSPEITSFLLDTQALAGCRSRVDAAGCEVHPIWANGALLLVPATEAHIAEAGIRLQAHNILMLATDVELIKQTLAQLPRRKRPQLKPEYHAEGSPHPASAESAYGGHRPENFAAPPAESGEGWHGCADEGGHRFGAWMQDVGLIVDKTFLHFPVAKDISDASTIVQSAPAASADLPEHLNPHRWPLTAQKDQ